MTGRFLSLSAIKRTSRKVGETEMKEYIVQALEKETIDAFDAHNAPELIRCNNCKHYRINTVYPGTNMIMTYCAKTGITERKPDWFCADGKEK